MDELFQRIEKRIRSLVIEYQTLVELNSELKQNKFRLTREKEQLAAKHHSVVHQVEKMISHLKSIEGSS